MFHLYLKFDEIHLSSFKSGQRYDLTLVQTFGKKKKFDYDMPFHWCLPLHEV